MGIEVNVMAGPVFAIVTARDVGDDDVDRPLLSAALERAGLGYRVCVWDDPQVDWSSFDAVVIRSTWDYTLRLDEYLDWIAAVPVPLFNPEPVVRWNVDKRYLSELAAAGIPVVPTQYVSASCDVDEALAVAFADGEAQGQVVVKPTVSAGSRDTARHDDRELARIDVERLVDAGRTAMIQPYQRGIETAAETGTVFFDGRFSHGFRKDPMLTGVAAAPDPSARHIARERVGSRRPSQSELAVAERAASWMAERFGRLAYLRVDLVPGTAGPLVIEVEAVEPSLFFTTDPTAADRFVAVLRTAVGGFDGNR